MLPLLYRPNMERGKIRIYVDNRGRNEGWAVEKNSITLGELISKYDIKVLPSVCFLNGAYISDYPLTENVLSTPIVELDGNYCSDVFILQFAVKMVGAL